jgi:hypothetical protein
LNPLIVTLTVGQIVYGVTLAYAETVPNEASVRQVFSANDRNSLFGSRRE